MGLFVFVFGNQNYDTQHAVVQAETMDEARALLLADMAEQAGQRPMRTYGLGELAKTAPDSSWHGRNGFWPSQFTPERLDEAAAQEAPPWVVEGPVVYLYGIDG